MHPHSHHPPFSLNETLTPIFFRCCPPLELLEEIKVLNESMHLNDERVRDATKALNDSMDTREMAKFNLSSDSDKEDLAQLEMDLEDLNVTSLNGKVRIHRMTVGGRTPDLTLLLWLFTHCIHQREAVSQIRKHSVVNMDVL